jgi:putative oxidoreductase
MKTTNLIARISFSLIFIFAALGHFSPATIAYAQASGVPLANLAVPASGVLAIVGALSIALGYKTRYGAAAIIAFLVPVTFMMHNFWAVSDPMMHQLQLTNFMKNVGLIGGALAFFVHGGGALSLDARAETRHEIVRGPQAVAG